MCVAVLRQPEQRRNSPTFTSAAKVANWLARTLACSRLFVRREAEPALVGAGSFPYFACAANFVAKALPKASADKGC